MMDTKKVLFENLTDFEFNSLIDSAKKGDNLSFEKILNIFKPIIYSLVSRFEINPSYKEDLIQEGIIGLYYAINKYDVTKSNNFSMYAYFWIKQAISRMADKSSCLIRIPIRKFQKIRKLKKHKQFKNENYNELVDCNFSFISLDNDNKNIDDLPLSEKIPTDDNPEKHIENLINYEDFNYLLSKLSERERDIIEKRYGLTTYIPLTLKEIAHQYKLTSESIRKIEIQALNKMKKTFQSCVDS